MIAPWPPYAAFLLATSVLGGLMPLAQVRVVQGLIDALTARATAAVGPPILPLLTPYLPWLGFLIGLSLLNALLYEDPFQRYLAARLDGRVRERLERRLYRKALSTPPLSASPPKRGRDPCLEWFESAAYYDALQRARLCLREGAIPDHLAGLQRTLAELASCVGVLVAMGRVHWAIPVGLLPGTIALIAWQIWTMRKSIAIDYQQTLLRRKQEYWRDLLTQRESAAEVRLFDLGGHFLQAWRGLTHRMLDEIWAARRVNVRRFHTMLAGNLALHSLVLLGLVLAAGRGALTPGAFVALLYVVRDYPDRIHNVSWWLQRLQRFCAQLGYLEQFLALQPEEPETVQPAPEALGASIRFEGVSFTYPGSAEPALRDVDLWLHPGERVAIVGENGAGKSTLVKLLLGLYQPTAGRIAIDGVDLQEVSPASWRSRTAAVFQEATRFPFTVRENIGLGRLECLTQTPSLERAARQSGVEDVIRRLPQGYETLLGKEFEGGQELSQGQWQKLALARAYLRDAEVLVLDEPASALDALAEREVYRQFLSLAKGKTVLLISHRLGSARLAGRVLFLQQGRLVEQGTHDELLALGGQYARLYELQAGWYR